MWSEMNISYLTVFLAAPFLLQGAAMFFDEFYFHRRRGLPRWERIGHPLDTLTVFFSFLILNQLPPTLTNLFIYISACTFSCLFVTKDEFVHNELCSAGETWLHSVLFILHPLVFLTAGLIWFGENLGLKGVGPMKVLIGHLIDGQLVIIFGFLMYQIIYWNFYAKKIS